MMVKFFLSSSQYLAWKSNNGDEEAECTSGYETILSGNVALSFHSIVNVQVDCLGDYAVAGLSLPRLTTGKKFYDKIVESSF